MDCTHCRKKFANKATLTRHQKTAKFCIKIQEENERKEKKNYGEPPKIMSVIAFLSMAQGHSQQHGYV